jgi:hypothetical protein
MALDLGAGQSVTSAGVAPVGQIPPGPCTVVISNTTPSGGTAGTVYLGTNSATLTATSGFPLPSNTTITVGGYPGSRGTTLYATAAGGTSVAVALLVSTGG